MPKSAGDRTPRRPVTLELKTGLTRMSAENHTLVDDEETGPRGRPPNSGDLNGYTVLEADTYQRALNVFEKNRDSIAVLHDGHFLTGRQWL